MIQILRKFIGKISATNDKTLIVNRGGESLWSGTAMNDLLIGTVEDCDLMIYSKKNLEEVLFKGKLVFLNDIFAFLPAESYTSFYVSDLSMMQVRKMEDRSIVENQFADYLLKTTSNLKIFSDLFADRVENFTGLNNQSKGFFQLTK